MRTHTPANLAALPVLVAACWLGGCSSAPESQVAEWDDNARRDTNEWLMRTYFDSQVDNAVVRQHTIWGHHFVDGTASLKPRGMDDLRVLAAHYTEHSGGVLNLPRAGAGDDLYGRRVETVRAALADAGVALESVEFRTDVWTGETVRSTRAGADVTRPSEEEPYTFHQGEK